MCSLILNVLGALKPLRHKNIIENELDAFGIRLNSKPPNIGFKKKDKGGINLTATVSEESIWGRLLKGLGWRVDCESHSIDVLRVHGSIEFCRPGHWSGGPFPSPGDLPKPGTEPRSSALQADSLSSEPPGKPSLLVQFSSVQFSSVTQLCPTLFDPMNCSMPGLPVHYQLPEFTQTHIH